MFINISDRPLERTVNIGGSPHACNTRNSRGLIHSRQCAPGAWREVIVSPHVQTTSSAECCQDGPVCDAVSVWGPQGSVGQQGDTVVSNIREPPTPRSPTSGTPLISRSPTSGITLTPRSPTPGNPRPSTRHLTTRLPEMTRTSGSIFGDAPAGD